jgi:HK97 family phage major capsid protein
LGLLNTSGIGAVVGGTNGAAPTYDNLIDMTSIVDSANAGMGNLGFLTNTKVRGKLRKTAVMGNTAAMPVWGLSDGMNNVAGYSAFVTNAVPSDLNKGTSTGVCSAVMFGNWADLMIGMWGGLDIMLDPYTGSTAGTKRVVALQDVDITLRRLASFAVMKDALTA